MLVHNETQCFRFFIASGAESWSRCPLGPDPNKRGVYFTSNVTGRRKEVWGGDLANPNSFDGGQKLLNYRKSYVPAS